MSSPSQGLNLFRDIDISSTSLQQLVRLLSASPTYYPWSIIPPDGKGFDFVNTIALPVSAGGAPPSPGPETIVTSMMCPYGYDGIIYRISNNYLGAGFNPGLPSLIWRIRNGPSLTNSKFVDNYNQIVVEYGTTNQPRDISGIFVSSGQYYLYTVTNQDPALPAGTSQVTCCFAGFFWPQQREKQNQVGQG
jgi:hypothetical protein